MAVARFAGATLGVALCACATAAVPRSPAAQTTARAEAIISTPDQQRTGKLSDYLADLRKTSCPDKADFREPDTIGLSAQPLTLRRFGSQRDLGDLVYAGGFVLTSDTSRLGGVSGLDVRDDGGLLAVSDEGSFVWIDLAEDLVTPTAARQARLTDAKGVAFEDKVEADAEGLALSNGLALVSFERDHRVLAYDVAECGAAARGAPIMFDEYGGELTGAFGAAGLSIDANQGAEALAVTDDAYLLVGLETLRDGKGPVSTKPLEAPPVFDHALGEDAPSLVGLDVLADGEAGDLRVFSLHRGIGGGVSPSVVLIETRLHRVVEEADAAAAADGDMAARSRERFETRSSRRLAELSPLLFNFDNFEGLAARFIPDGSVRLYIVSDNNFSASQRTLLMVFDLKRD